MVRSLRLCENDGGSTEIPSLLTFHARYIKELGTQASNPFLLGPKKPFLSILSAEHRHSLAVANISKTYERVRLRQWLKPDSSKAAQLGLSPSSVLFGMEKYVHNVREHLIPRY